MSTVLTIALAIAVGALLGYLVCAATIRHLLHRVRELKKGQASGSLLWSVTKALFVTTQIFALGWVSVSYLIALYSTIRLKQPFPAVDLSQQAITAILGANTLKVIENIFEHNDGPVFGYSRQDKEE